MALTRVAAIEWARAGIRVNAIGPGCVDTPLLSQALAAGRLDADEILAHIPRRRLAPPVEIAAIVAFLVSEASSYITGQALFVDGGVLAGYGIGSRPVGQ